MLRALGSASCDITYETRGTICCGNWVLCVVISYTRQGVRIVMVIRFCLLCNIIYETTGTFCYGHCIPRLVISHMRQVIRSVRGIGFCVLSYHMRDRGYDLLRELGSAPRQRARLVSGIAFCVL